MAVTEGEDSYVSVATADAYATARNMLSFIDLIDEEKDAYLISATDFLDTLIWIGTATESDQSLAWPRNATYYDPKYGVEVTLADETPVEIGEAQIELALYFVNNGSFTGKITSNTNNSGPDSIKVGSIELGGLRSDIQNTTINGVAMPTMVANLIGHLLGVNATSNSGLFRPTWRAW